jgi:hypothetical protein
MSLTYMDIECLKAARDEGLNAWRPWRGVYGRAKQLAELGYLKVAGMTAMPPHVCYVLSHEGEQALMIAAALSPTISPALREGK